MCLIICFSTTFTFADNSRTEAKIRGKVTTEKGENIEFASVYFKKTSYGGVTDKNGEYYFSAPSGNYTLVISQMGYKTIEQEVSLKKGEEKFVNITMEQGAIELGEVVITEKSAVQRVKESAYNVTAISTKNLQHTTLDLAHTLDRVSGVKLRESGGVGSESSISLNGFSGRHVKIFMDGVPMDGFGNSFQLNNIPVEMVDRIEVYKGVVPIEFGGDAIGGAINIVTKKIRNTSVDVSYSYGSFNTHKTNIAVSHTTRSGFTAQINAYQNYSDNNYWVDVRLLNSNGIYDDETTRVRRFHDTYHNEAVVANFGFVGKSFADQLLFGINLGKNYADIQNGNNMNVVFGERFRRGSTVMPTLKYQKKNLFVRNLNVSINGNFNFGYTQIVDTAQNRKYSWLGTYTERTQSAERSRTFYKYRNNNGAFTGNISYKIAGHSFMLNNVFSTFHRKGYDELSPSLAEDYPEISYKNTLGASYVYTAEKWNANVFYKRYLQHVKSHIETSSGSGIFTPVTGEFTYDGYGAAGTYFILRDLQLKASYEKTVRLPTAREIFGDADLENANKDIQPEESNNYNINLGYSLDVAKKHHLIVEVGYMYRNIDNYIRRSINMAKGTAESKNDGRVVNKGFNTEVRYSYDNLFTVGGNFSFLDIRSKAEDYRKNMRVPNAPYLYGNADASIFFNNLGWKGNTLTIGYNLMYFYKYFLNWEDFGDVSTKNYIPTQFSHDIDVAYSIKDGTYIVSAGCRNLTNENLYDNYSLQKPGRSFYVKFKYHFSTHQKNKYKKFKESDETIKQRSNK